MLNLFPISLGYLFSPLRSNPAFFYLNLCLLSSNLNRHLQSPLISKLAPIWLMALSAKWVKYYLDEEGTTYF